MAGKKLYASYSDEHQLMEAAKQLVAKGVHVDEVYSPFPIHGLDPIIGIKKTRLGICAFMYGITGTILAVIGMWYFMIHDWPMNIGGKPSMALYMNIPSFIPVTFEFTVLCAAHGMAITYLLRNWTLPGIAAKNPAPETTDDRFIMEINTGHNHVSESDIKSTLEGAGGMVELTEADAEH